MNPGFPFGTKLGMVGQLVGIIRACQSYQIRVHSTWRRDRRVHTGARKCSWI